ncbi:HzsA-related protein [Gilvimarinus japonicus]|uniref:Hydrazine synthase alpha subunit middle domain-containing protein n=1 Tax=Gilvimarinus japonicus TaxID=1796469 RepID=A0ABV7HQ40_9GAMM
MTTHAVIPQPILPSDTGWRVFARRLLSGALFASVLVGCGGGGGGGISGSGQPPDPVVKDIPIAYIERPLPRDDDGELLPLTPAGRDDFNPGARLFIKARATDDALAINVTDQAFAEGADYDVKDLTSHPDGSRLLFAMRAPEIEDAPDEDQPTWNIWEYDLSNRQLQRVISSDIVAEVADDISPRYIPGGRIVFASSRQVRSRALLLDANKPQYAAESESGDGPAFVLHSMTVAGDDIRQLSFNQGHDWAPLLRDDGRLLYTRADSYRNNRVSYYTSNPNGTDVRPHYGYHTRLAEDTPWLFNPELMADGRLVGIYKPRDELPGGDIVAIDTSEYVEDDQTVLGTEGDALDKLTVLPVTLDGSISRHGYFSALAPLFDDTNRLLVSWSQCRLEALNQDTGDSRYVPCTEANLAAEYEAAPPVYGLFLYNVDDNSQQPVVVPAEDVIYTDLVVMGPRPAAAPVDGAINESLASEGLGILDIRSVYDLDGVDTSGAGIETLRDPAQTIAAERSARFLRLLGAVSQPPRDIKQVPGSAFGVSRAQGMKEIIGYVPVAPDGSVRAAVPADTAFTIAVLDANGMRISPRHQNWLQVRPGETFQCNGCHQRDSQVPHGRLDAGPMALNTGAETSGLPFANTEPRYVAEMGETMAEVYARIAGAPRPQVDLVYNDVWTDPGVRAKDPSFDFLYSELAEGPDPARVPTSAACQQQWSAACRVTINYPAHIQPLWQLPRVERDADNNVTADNTCTSCHSPADADGLVQIPAGQLDLSATETDADQMLSYQQLLRTRFELELVDGVLQERLIATGEFEADEDGELILDAEGNPIPIFERVPIGRIMSPGGAFASGRFFSRFTEFDPMEDTFDHRGLMNDAERKLLAEWLDIGAQYYNNPFDVPE